MRRFKMEKRLKQVGCQGFAGMVVGTLDMALWDALAREGRSSCGRARCRETAAAAVSQVRHARSPNRLGPAGPDFPLG